MFRRKPQDDHIYRVVTICLGAEKAEEFKKELEQKTGYEFNVRILGKICRMDGEPVPQRRQKTLRPKRRNAHHLELQDLGVR